jgi:tricorn protease
MTWLSAKRSVEALDDYAVSADRAQLAYRKAESLEIKPTGLKQDVREPAEEVVSVDLDRIQVTVEPPAEWRRMYHEAWRLMRDSFWAPTWPGGLSRDGRPRPAAAGPYRLHG